MSNFFNEVLSDAKCVEERLLGPDYQYWKQIKSPGDMGMTSEGGISEIADNVSGLMNYIDVLASGSGAGTKVSGGLGDKFFLKTAATCKDKTSGKIVDRYMYVDNIPDGNIPFISSAAGENFTSLEGLIPGTLGNLNALNPMLIFQAFVSGSQPECQEVSLETVNVNNERGTETQFVTTTDIGNINPCNFTSNKNQVTGKVCRESFTNLNLNTSYAKNKNVPRDILVQLFYASLGVLGIYILLSMMKRIKERK